jgi:hypothetical protein
VLRVARYEGLSRLPASYDSLFQEARAGSLFHTKQWFRNFQETVVSPGEAVVIYGVEPDGAGSPVAALFLWRQERRRSFLSTRRLESLSNYYTSLFGPVIAGGSAQLCDIVTALAVAIWRERCDWDLLDLKPLDAKSSFYELFVRALRDAGMVVQTYVCFGNWYLEVAGRSYAQYVDSLPSVLKKNIPYNARRLERSGGQVVIMTSGDAMARGLEDYEKVYRASWKNPEPYPQFIPGLIRTATSEGWLRMGLVYVGDEPAAAQIWLVYAGIASIYKIAYDERFAKLSVGTLLTARLMQHVIDIDKVDIVDYLSGDDAYKRQWMSHRRERMGILAMNTRSLRGVGQIFRHVVGKAAKRRLSRGRSLEANRNSKRDPAVSA